MKNIMKVVIGFIVFNAIVGNLRQEGIIAGKITINYPKLINKVSSSVFVEFVSTEQNTNWGVEPTRQRHTIHHQNLPVYEQQWQEPELEDYFEDVPKESNVHIISDGETLISLASIYGVSWRRIKEANGIRDARKIRVGQKLWIPTT